MQKVVAVAATVVVLATLTLTSVIGGAVSAILAGTHTSGPSQAALDDIPDDYLTLYQHAADLCPGLDWALLAAIGKIESDHGRSKLPGVAPGTHHPTSHAMGPMQFLQPTFDNVIARHNIPPGGRAPPSPWHKHDAIHAASFYLCDNGVADGDIRAALFTYNRSHDYVDGVLAQADTYRAASTPAKPVDIRLDWRSEQATVPDPTSGGYITPRTYNLVRALQANGMTGNGIGCFAYRSVNPGSDHPRGRACDVMFDPNNAESVAEGWQLANWLIANQARFGVKYLIWQDLYWSAADPRWGTYESDAYGCPNPSPAADTACHRDHVHISSF